MQVLIGTAHHIDEVKQRLHNELDRLEKSGIPMTVQESCRGTLRFFGCSLSRDQRSSYQERWLLLNQLVVDVLADVIINDCELRMVRKLVKDLYNYSSDEELETVCEFVDKNLHAPRTYDRVYRKSRIISRLLEFLERNHEMVLEGFIRFRLKDYVEELEEAVERAVDDYLVEKEYQEFIDLIRCFIESQETKFAEVHVVPDSEQGYRIVDESDQPVDCEHIDDLKLVLASGGLEYEDLIISSLVILAPKLVVMHLGTGARSRPTVAETLQNIFGSRYRECRDCSRCEGGTGEATTAEAGRVDSE